MDYGAGEGPWAVFAADLDGDGNRDLAVVNLIGNTVSILKNNGGGTFTAKVDYGTGNQPTSVFAADLDGDGDRDLAVTNAFSNTVSILKNLAGPINCSAVKGDINASGNLTPADVVLMLICTFSEQGGCELCSGDVNCDGALTLVDAVLELLKVFSDQNFACELF